jgi:hypothetical protein
VIPFPKTTEDIYRMTRKEQLLYEDMIAKLCAESNDPLLWAIADMTKAVRGIATVFEDYRKKAKYIDDYKSIKMPDPGSAMMGFSMVIGEMVRKLTKWVNGDDADAIAIILFQKGMRLDMAKNLGEMFQEQGITMEKIAAAWEQAQLAANSKGDQK